MPSGPPPHGLAAEEGRTGSIVWLIACPYVLVGGKVDLDGHGAKLELSWDGKAWQAVTGDLDGSFAPGGPARYRYYLRCQLSGDARLKRLGIVNDLQMAPLALPGMAIGDNAFVYTDKSPGERRMRITHSWVERSTARPPPAPPARRLPGRRRRGGRHRPGLPLAAASPGRRRHHRGLRLRALQLRRHALAAVDEFRARDLAHRRRQGAVHPAIGRAAGSGPQVLRRVRARSGTGVWGPWGATWSFTPHSAEPPLEVAIDYDQGRGTGILRWKPNPAGRKAVAFRIYGSDEKGFSASDREYQVSVGQSKELKPRFPANFIAETAGTELPVLGVSAPPSANKTYYRVVAVDEQGKRSGPSDFASAPRPVIYTMPLAAAKVGEAYRYRCAANRSLGDLRTRQVNGKEVAGFYDIETPRFAMKSGPPWLKIDAETGELSGTPDAPGTADITIVAVIDRENRKLDDATLKWGNEKVVSHAVERVGEATQTFAIDVSR